MKAFASCRDNPTVYTVTYPGSNAVDMNCSYGYLRCLARHGFEVRVAETATTPAHIINAQRRDK